MAIPASTTFTAFDLSDGYINATSSNIISGPKKASVAVLFPLTSEQRPDRVLVSNYRFQNP